MKNREPWNFCETPKEKCTMNYCDENGCQNRKRNYVQGNELIADVSGSAFTILNKGKVVENILFKTLEEARNYLKMKYPKRRFKEPQKNVFVCANHGTKFIIEEHHYR